MLRSLLLRVVDYPPLLDRVRFLIEAGHRGEHAVIRRELGARSGKLLDLPCGTGIFSVHFADTDYTGVDLGEKYLARARKKYPRKTFLTMDARSLQFPDASFDAVLVIGFLHHLEDNDVATALREIHRVLRPDGVLLLMEDVPTRSRWNVLGRLLQTLDAGGRIRPAASYECLLRPQFTITRSYPMRAGLWDYTVFVARRN